VFERSTRHDWRGGDVVLIPSLSGLCLNAYYAKGHVPFEVLIPSLSGLCLNITRSAAA